MDIVGHDLDVNINEYFVNDEQISMEHFLWNLVDCVNKGTNVGRLAIGDRLWVLPTREANLRRFGHFDHSSPHGGSPWSAGSYSGQATKVSPCCTPPPSHV